MAITYTRNSVETYATVNNTVPPRLVSGTVQFIAKRAIIRPEFVAGIAYRLTGHLLFNLIYSRIPGRNKLFTEKFFFPDLNTVKVGMIYIF